MITDWLAAFDRPLSIHPQILIVDNASTDGSATAIYEMCGKLREHGWQVALVRNPINLGGWGSLNLNLDLISNFGWVTTFHQDDQYAPNHLIEHMRACKLARKNVGMVSSESVSIDEKGRVLGYPRGAWMQSQEATQVNVFLNLIRNHFLPFSGASFRVEFLLQSNIPWTSTAFPDTELLLGGIPLWNYEYLEEPKVTYLENMQSESHSLNSVSRDHGSAAALLRIFSSAKFLNLVCGLENQEFNDFCFELVQALRVRFSQQVLARTVARYAIETAIEIRSKSGYEVDYEAIFVLYLEDEDFDAAKLARRLLAFQNDNQYSIDKQLNQRESPDLAHHFLKPLFLRILGRLPSRCLKLLWRALFRFKITRRALRQWDMQ
jgi:glycosyltransferase involved in cell wall biosynthesis